MPGILYHLACGEEVFRKLDLSVDKLKFMVWDESRMMVVNPRNNKEWSVKQFFSNDGMYGAYTEI